MTESRTLRLWRHAALFEGASPEAIAAVAAASQPFHFTARQMLFQRGEAGDTAYVLAEGRVRLVLMSPQGHELLLRQSDAGATLGEMAFLDGKPRSAMAQAVTAGHGLMLTRREFDMIPAPLRASLFEAMLRFVTGRLRQSRDQFENTALYGLSGRLARFFLLGLNRLHGDDLPPEPKLQFLMTHGELAALLGTSREKVTHALAFLEEEGAVRHEGGALLCLPERLEAMARDAEI